MLIVSRVDGGATNFLADLLEDLLRELGRDFVLEDRNFFNHHIGVFHLAVL